MRFGTTLTVCHVLVTLATSQDIEDFVPKNVQKMFSVLSQGHCLEPVAPENGHVDYSSTMVGATANVTCDDNYTYLGQGSKLTCMASGTWRSYTDKKGQCYQSTWTNPTGNFMEGLPYNLMTGTRVTVLGRCTVADMFTVAFVDLATDRKVLAMEVDMSTSTVRRYHEVAGMAPDDTWSTFPFTGGQRFNITLSVLVNSIQILVDDQEMNLCKYSTQALSLTSHMTIHGGDNSGTGGPYLPLTVLQTLSQ